jgi:hypothetical protein
VGDLDTDAARLLGGREGCHVVDSRDVAGLTAALASCRGRRYRRDVGEFDRRALAAKLAGVLDEAISRR